MLLIVFVVPMRTIKYEPKAVFFRPISKFGLHSTIVDGIKVSHTQSLYWNLIRKYTTPYIIYLVIRIVYILNDTACHVDISSYLIVHISLSMIPTRSLFACMYNKDWFQTTL